MDTSIDSLSDTESNTSNSSWILVNGLMCDDIANKRKFYLSCDQEPVHEITEKDLGPTVSGHESDTSDGISIISEFDSDHDRNVYSEEDIINSPLCCSNISDEIEDTTLKKCAEENDYNDDDLIENVSSVLDAENDNIMGKVIKKLPKPRYFLTISIFGAVVAVSSVFILQLINSYNYNRNSSSEFTDLSNENFQLDNYNNDISQPEETTNEMHNKHFDVAELCASKHKNDVHQVYNEKKCLKTYKKKIRNEIKELSSEKKLDFKTKQGSQEHLYIKNNNTEPYAILDVKIRKTKTDEDDNTLSNKLYHKKTYKVRKNVKQNYKYKDEMQAEKKKYLTQKYIQNKEEFLNLKEKYLKKKERYLRNLAATIKETIKNSRKVSQKINKSKGETNNGNFDKSTKYLSKHKSKQKTIYSSKNYEKIDKDHSFQKSKKHFSKSYNKYKRNNTISGDWYHNLYNERSQIRKNERLTDWIFDRAEMRNKKRDKAKWYFQWMTDREQFRYKRGYKYSAV